MGVRVRMHQKLLSVGPWRDERALDMNLIGILAGEGQKCVPDIIYVPEVKGSDFLPQQGVGPDGHGSAVEKLPAGGFVVLEPALGDLASGSNWPSMKVRMLSSVPTLVIKSCRYLLNCCSTEVMLSSMWTWR